MDAFHEILTYILEENKLNKNTASKFLKTKGIDVERAIVSTYVNCTVVPRTFRAKQILQAFGYELSDEELREALELSRQVKKSQSYGNDKYFATGIKIPFSKLSSVEKNPLKIELMLKERINEINKRTNKKGTISYVATLIKADLDYGLLDDVIKEELDEE